MIDAADGFCALANSANTWLVDARAGQPSVCYFGPRFEAAPGELDRLFRQPVPPAGIDSVVPVALVPQLGVGFPGQSVLRCHRDGRHAATAATLESIESCRDGYVFVSRCAATGIELTSQLTLDPATGVVRGETTLRNVGEDRLHVDELPGLCLPVPAHWHVSGVDGRWALEFQAQHSAPFTGAWVRENRSGRTSHHTPPFVVLHEPAATDAAGTVLALHLGWSGNHRLVVESLPDGRRYVSLAAAFFPGELCLGPGESVSTPPVFAATSQRGFDGASDCLHEYCRRVVLRPSLREKPRPVHFNTWEALYFDVSHESLPPLIDQAAALGIERFVLDDGWFVGRRDDAAALGDWRVDPQKFPDGLRPIAEHVTEQGMEFGLWLEPEMVNPDSDLYRAHPDWAQGYPGVPALLGRHQLVLDVSRTDVREYLLSTISALLETLPIGYLKWDMNRDLTQPGDTGGRSVAAAHTHALYAVLDELRRRFPAVEIESCASGGGRADYGVLARTDRIWTSDSNDALDRLTIQRGFSRWFPPRSWVHMSDRLNATSPVGVSAWRFAPVSRCSVTWGSRRTYGR